MKYQCGFTLIEMAMVLMIIGLLLGIFLVPLSAKMDQQKIQETEQRLEKIKEALIGFATVQGYLPCPNLTPVNDGKGHNPPCNQGKEGEIPWLVLGIDRYDAWGHPIRYRIDDRFGKTEYDKSDPDNTGFPNPPNTLSKLRVRNRNDEPLTNEDINSQVIAIIFSCGKNGVPDADNEGGVTTDAPSCVHSTSGNQKPNNSIYTQDVYVENEFDDILVWLPKTIFINRLTIAGAWPPS